MANFQELVESSFAGGVNALCLERSPVGDFGEIVRAFDAREPITVLDEEKLLSLALSGKGDLSAEASAKVEAAVNVLIEDMRLLRDLGRDPVLNLISGYPKDEEAGVVATDVFSWHVDSAPVEADTWLCTYYGSPSEGLRNEDAIQKIKVPDIRAQLLAEYRRSLPADLSAKALATAEALAKEDGKDDEDFRAWLSENCYDLHYMPLRGPEASKTLSLSNGLYSFGIGHLWRIAVAWPGSPVPPCIHRAPATIPGEPRLLLIC